MDQPSVTHDLFSRNSRCCVKACGKLKPPREWLTPSTFPQFSRGSRKKIRAHFDKPLRVEEVARELGMSVLGFHAHFKAVTAMSPLQFQKQLRLQEAQRLMLTENLDAAEVGYCVRYEAASHFSREYKRHFSNPPIRDVEQMRELAGANAAP